MQYWKEILALFKESWAMIVSVGGGGAVLEFLRRHWSGRKNKRLAYQYINSIEDNAQRIWNIDPRLVDAGEIKHRVTIAKNTIGIAESKNKLIQEFILPEEATQYGMLLSILYAYRDEMGKYDFGMSFVRRTSNEINYSEFQARTTIRYGKLNDEFPRSYRL